MRLSVLLITAHIASTNAIPKESIRSLSTPQGSATNLSPASPGNDDSLKPEANTEPTSGLTGDEEIPTELIAVTGPPASSNCGSDSTQPKSDTRIASNACPSGETFGQTPDSTGTKSPTHGDELCPPLLKPVCCFGTIKPLGVSITRCFSYNYLEDSACRRLQFIFCCHDIKPNPYYLYDEGEICTGVHGAALLNTANVQIDFGF